MPTDKPRITFTISDEMRSRIDEYRFANRLKSQTQAIVELIERGLEKEAMNPSPISIERQMPAGERSILEAYRDAELQAQRFALDLLRSHPAQEKEKQAE